MTRIAKAPSGQKNPAFTVFALPEEPVTTPQSDRDQSRNKVDISGLAGRLTCLISRYWNGNFVCVSGNCRLFMLWK